MSITFLKEIYFFLKKNYFILNYVSFCVGMYMCIQVPGEVRGIGSSGAGLTDSCEPLMWVGTEHGSSGAQ